MPYVSDKLNRFSKWKSKRPGMPAQMEEPAQNKWTGGWIDEEYPDEDEATGQFHPYATTGAPGTNQKYQDEITGPYMAEGGMVQSNQDDQGDDGMDDGDEDDQNKQPQQDPIPEYNVPYYPDQSGEVSARAYAHGGMIENLQRGEQEPDEKEEQMGEGSAQEESIEQGDGEPEESEEPIQILENKKRMARGGRVPPTTGFARALKAKMSY